MWNLLIYAILCVLFAALGLYVLLGMAGGLQ